ncbi:methylated-DNA--protein-cysteine methyltransferase [Natronococcus amylolyticus DSM 10524]|uniref:methylated-DNA--[protein]-cysteine S-methyltransferase n=1 Tax=Natronococcus amylolyticus DSM 10524 TaxID=1227497 RepID=L9XDV4_9EURY|nr:MGMT family protein [Natronococcus amylolyticus]ELY58813.1 methylated-DNA--protein-cysteine methyltransferase [Natronococcus amylolyticus DSM 10524]
MRSHVFDHGIEIDDSRIDASSETIREQLREYEDGARKTFALEIEYPEDFTGAVMRSIAAIPFGETRTYGDLATELETAPIAVGQACGRNPIPVVVPCHRVVGHDSPGGYGGGLELKRCLLEHEGIAVPEAKRR